MFLWKLILVALNYNLNNFDNIYSFIYLTDYPGQTGGAGTSGAANAQGHGLSFAGTNLWRCDAHVIEVCDLNCLDVDPKDGCPFCIQTCRKYHFFFLFCYIFYNILFQKLFSIMFSENYYIRFDEQFGLIEDC